MIITIPWLKEHLHTNANEAKIIDQLTNKGTTTSPIYDALVYIAAVCNASLPFMAGSAVLDSL